ncbi:LacI family DNA-binding transcriptional regulator [Modestobacter altitudinis]|uniref:LacI family DNA-binding transcriptional regulator n=1 Tax=Modestobacter altitudinis TaxID=2213158 RepID=UPI00110C927D|nr:LacI family DNA-binding transcriptional regulator [Modestobacter altitudinis]
MVRLRDVAAHAGVSVRTVSNVVNDFRYVAPDTRARVQASIAALGYRPNVAARTLRSGRTGLLSLVVPEIDSPYFSELAARTVRIAEADGWTVLIDQTDGDGERERRLLRGERSQLVDGVIFSPWSVTAEELAERPDATPIVLLGEHAGTPPVDHVVIDNVAAAAAAVTHLVQRGRRRIAAVGASSAPASETARQRELGYRQAIAAAGLPGLEAPVSSLHRAEGHRAMTELLRADPAPDAAFCFSDELALGALRAVVDAGLRVPEDVALVGFDDVEDGRFAVPRLTTVAPDKDGIARLALGSLRDRLAGDESPAQVITAQHRLVVRESS